MRFGETETDGGRDILRAAEVTADPLLRRLYLVHAIDELRHGVMFRQRAASLLTALRVSSKPAFQADWLAPGGHGVDDLHVDGDSDHSMLAFLHLSEKAAASRFTVYRDVLKDDPPTCAVFEEILHDETFHMNYTLTQLARISPRHHRRHIWRARLSRVWKAYLRGGERVGRRDRYGVHDAAVLHPDAAVRVACQASRATGASGMELAGT